MVGRYLFWTDFAHYLAWTKNWRIEEWNVATCLVSRTQTFSASHLACARLWPASAALNYTEKRITFIVDARLGNVSSLVGEGRVAVIWGQGDILTGLGVVISPRQCSVASLGSGNNFDIDVKRCCMHNIQRRPSFVESAILVLLHLSIYIKTLC